MDVPPAPNAAAASESADTSKAAPTARGQISLVEPMPLDDPIAVKAATGSGRAT
jgi:hypothetical protein